MNMICQKSRNSLLKFCCVLSAALFISGCTCFYYYRLEENTAWIKAGYCEFVVDVSPAGELVVNYELVRDSLVTLVDSTVIIDPYFSRRGELKPLDMTDDYDSQFYSLEGVPVWETDAPLKVFVQYEVDSSGVRLKKEYSFSLKKYSHCVFSVH